MTDIRMIQPTIDIDTLHAGLDALGREIKVGTLVRSFDHAITMQDGRIGRCEVKGDYASFIEGIVEAVGVEIEGCPRYAILCTYAQSGDEERSSRVGEVYYPPVNGTPTSLGRTCAGVFQRVIE